MKSCTLTPRLKLIVEFASDNSIVADIGCDHGKVSVALAKNDVIVHAVDISKPSLQKARDLAKIEGVQDSISFHCDDGLNSIINAHLDAVIIAGMGWRMIKSILENNIEGVKKIGNLILQPMDSVIEMREYLYEYNYEIIDEKLVWDDKRLYTVIKVRYGKGKDLNLTELLLGPKIIQNNDVLLGDLVDKELKKRKKILKGLKKANTADNNHISKIEEEINLLKNMQGGRI